MIFYNGFNLLVDVVVAVVTYKIAFGFGFDTGYSERDQEIQEDAERWGDYYYETQRERELGEY